MSHLEESACSWLLHHLHMNYKVIEESAYQGWCKGAAG